MSMVRKIKRNIVKVWALENGMSLHRGWKKIKHHIHVMNRIEKMSGEEKSLNFRMYEAIYGSSLNLFRRFTNLFRRQKKESELSAHSSASHCDSPMATIAGAQ